EIGQRILHTCDFVNFGHAPRQALSDIGGRQSAFEWAALVSDAGAAAVYICHRHDSPSFKMSDWSWVAPLVDITTDDRVGFAKISDQTGRNAPSPILGRSLASGSGQVEVNGARPQLVYHQTSQP